VDGFGQGAGAKSLNLTAMAGALSISLLTAGSLDSLIGLGAETIRAMSDFSKVLLPTLAAAAATAGAVGSATVQQVTTVFFVDLLLQLIQGLLLPAVYLYIGALTAAAMLPENRLGGIADALKKIVVWILSAVLIAFTVYLSVVRVIAGTADGAAVKVARAAISGAVPVVGSILSEASETVLAGAGVLKGTIGVFGTLAILSICAYPFLQLGIQYLLYKLTAFLAGTVGSTGLCRLIDGLGGAFGLVLGMTGACALLLLVSIMSFVAAVTP
ncbi:MAG: stage III sporulation protein AE, partial [Oscillibacter sp.]|jgi:stage III sporulation protein AE|nr:stage III sporulation protein AE [Oscillibacter sp.]